MSKKILTLDNLYDFYSLQNKTCKFSAEKYGYQISVQIPAKFEINKNIEDNSLLFCKVKLMHSGENRNHSCVTDDALKRAAQTLAYKPILANFMEYVDEKTGETLKDFTSHDMEINEDGTINYLEKQIGCFTSDDPYFEIEEETGHNFLYGYCAIPREYTDAVSIIERKNGTKVSVELIVNELSFNAKTKLLELTDVVISGATCLGKNPNTLEDVGEGMLNARLDIADFSIENNSVRFEQDENVIKLLQELSDKIDILSSYTRINSTKGGQSQVNKFEELLNKYNKTVEEITFEYEGLSDEELEAKFAELFEEPKKKLEDDDVPATPVVEDDNTAEPTPEPNEPENEPTVEPEPEPTTPDSTDDNSSEGGETFAEKLVKTYEISHDDIRFALYNLLSTFEEMDNEWYFIENVYDNYFVYTNWSGNKTFGQAYTKSDDNVSFDGERYELFKELLTSSEKAALEEMRSNYAKFEEISDKLAKYEAEPEKIQVLESNEYSSIADKAEFIELKKQENHFDLSVDELKKTADEIILSYAKKGSLTFSSNEEEKHSVGMKQLPISKKTSKRSRYGGLGKKED